MILSDVELITAATKTKLHKLLAVAFRIAINCFHSSSKDFTGAHPFQKEMNACCSELIVGFLKFEH